MIITDHRLANYNVIIFIPAKQTMHSKQTILKVPEKQLLNSNTTTIFTIKWWIMKDLTVLLIEVLINHYFTLVVKM